MRALANEYHALCFDMNRIQTILDQIVWRNVITVFNQPVIPRIPIRLLRRNPHRGCLVILVFGLWIEITAYIYYICLNVWHSWSKGHHIGPVLFFWVVPCAITNTRICDRGGSNLSRLFVQYDQLCLIRSVSYSTTGTPFHWCVTQINP